MAVETEASIGKQAASLVDAGLWPTPEMALPPSSTSRPSVRAASPILITFWMSTTGLAPETVTVSSSAPTRRSAFTVAVNVAGSSMPSRFTVEKPGSVKLTM